MENDYHYCLHCSTTEDHVPNAPLYKAAPALLEALAEVILWGETVDPNSRNWDKAVTQARAAIAQAKGEHS